MWDLFVASKVLVLILHSDQRTASFFLTIYQLQPFIHTYEFHSLICMPHLEFLNEVFFQGTVKCRDYQEAT